MTGRIGVLGAGGMGSAFAAFLARSGHDVMLIGRGSEHIRAVAASGLEVLPPDSSSYLIPVRTAVYADDLPRGSIDLLIVLTKTFDTATAGTATAPALAPDGVAVSLQNGLGNDAVLANAFGSARSLVGVTTVGATLQQPGRISISGVTSAGQSLSHLGTMGRAGARHRADEVAEVLTAAGLPAVHVPDIAVHIWGKLAMAVMSPISSVLRMTVGSVWATPEGRSLVERMFDEVIAVGERQGVHLDREAAWTHAQQVFAGTGQHYTSMCTDIMTGRRTELASMAGAVRALAADDLPVAVHSTVLALLGAMGVDGR